MSEVHPITLKNRAVDEAKQAVTDTKQMIYDTVDDTRTYFVDRGGVRWNNVGTVAVVVGAVVVLATAGEMASLIRRIGK